MLALEEEDITAGVPAVVKHRNAMTILANGAEDDVDRCVGFCDNLPSRHWRVLELATDAVEFVSDRRKVVYASVIREGQEDDGLGGA
jgi:hypothetical protein